jgi:hypothetical protein
LKGAKFKNLEDVLVICIEQGNVKIGAASEEVGKEQVKVLGQQIM